MQKLQGKIALITGGNSGIGLATAHLFAQQGATVIITGRDQQTLDSAVAAIGHGARAIQTDTTSLPALDALFATIKADFGGLDTVFVNAGVAEFASLRESEEALYTRQFDTNVKGAFFTIQKAEPLLRDGGTVVINASVVAHIGIAGATLYSATKAAVRSLARGLSLELAERGIRVNVVSPGYIRTPIYNRLGMDDATIDGDFASGQVSPVVPARRFGLPEEIAKAALFLASSDSSYVVGEEILVDGGVAAVGVPGVARG